MNTIITRSRRLEQFLYAHGVFFINTSKDSDGITFWEYDDSEENRRIVEEFRLGVSRINAKKGV